MARRSSYSKRRRVKTGGKRLSRASYSRKGPAVGYLPNAKKGRGGAPFSVSITGLTSGAAIVGDAIGYTTDPASATEAVKWSINSDPAAAGLSTSATYTPFLANDADTLYCHVTDTIDGETYTVTRSALIRQDFGTAPAVADGQNTTVDDGPAYNIDASASGAGLDFGYVLSGMPAGVSINSGTGAITGTPTEALSGTATVTATDQYGATYQDTFTFAASLRTQATAADGLGPFVWTVDDTSTTVDASADFTLNGNTGGTYSATGLPAGVSINSSTGLITIDPVEPASSGTIVITYTDLYGRETTSTATHTTSLRAQATGGTDLDLSYAISTTITPQDLLANWTDNGNELTFVSVTPALPSGLSIGSSGILSGTTGGTAVADATHTLTMQDEYGRETSDTFALEVVEGVTIPHSPVYNFDAKDTSTLVSGSPNNLQSIEDKVAGTVLFEQTTASAQPGTGLDTFTGGTDNVITGRFGDFLQSDTAWNITGDWHIAVVLELLVSGRAIQYVLSDASQNGGASGLFIEFGVQRWGFIDSAGTQHIPTETLSLNTPTVLNIEKSGTTYSFWLNGTSAGSATGADYDWGTPDLLRRADGFANAAFVSLFGQLVVYDKTLSASERGDLVTELQGNWSL